jgi:hypothetical protein
MVLIVTTTCEKRPYGLEFLPYAMHVSLWVIRLKYLANWDLNVRNSKPPSAMVTLSNTFKSTLVKLPSQLEGTILKNHENSKDCVNCEEDNSDKIIIIKDNRTIRNHPHDSYDSHDSHDPHNSHNSHDSRHLKSVTPLLHIRI